MEKWFKARLESILDSIIFTAVVAGGAVVLAAMKDLPVPVIIVVFVGVFVIVLVSIRLLAWKMKRRVFQIKSTYEEDKGWDNGKSVCECGLIFTNSSSANLNDCQARLIDLEYETPHKESGLQNFPKAEDLICAKSVPAFGSAKIPLFRWKGNCIDNRLDIVYQSKNEHGVANEPILVLLNIWAESTPAIYVVCKLAKGQWGGFKLFVVKTGLQKDNLSLATFQKPIQNKEGHQP